MLFRCAFADFFECLWVREFVDGDVFLGFFAVGILAHGFWQQGAHDLLEWGDVVVGNPLAELHEAGGDEWFWVDERGDRTQGEIGLRWWADIEDGARGVAVAQGDAHTAASDHRHIVGDHVVKDELGGAVDQHSSRLLHGWQCVGEMCC